MIRFYQFTTLALGIACMTSCMTIDKAKRTLDKHPESAAQYCADKFPVKTDSVVNEQIDERIKEQEEAQRVRDSLLNLADGRNKIIDQLIDQLDSVKAGTYVDIESLQARIRSLTTNTTAIRTRTNTVIREVVKPCSTKTITITKENTARVEAFRLGMERVQRESDGWKEKAQKRGKMMWSLFLLIAIYIGLRVVKATWLRWLPVPVVVLGMASCAQAHKPVPRKVNIIKDTIPYKTMVGVYGEITFPDTIKHTCKDTVPSHYKILYNKNTNQYVVKTSEHKGMSFYIGFNSSWDGESEYERLDRATKYVDSCAAKKAIFELEDYNYFGFIQLDKESKRYQLKYDFKPIK